MRTALHDLAATLRDITREGDPLGHLHSWLHCATHPAEADQPIRYHVIQEEEPTHANDHRLLTAARRQDTASIYTVRRARPGNRGLHPR